MPLDRVDLKEPVFLDLSFCNDKFVGVLSHHVKEQKSFRFAPKTLSIRAELDELLILSFLRAANKCSALRA